MCVPFHYIVVQQTTVNLKKKKNKKNKKISGAYASAEQSAVIGMYVDPKRLVLTLK